VNPKRNIYHCFGCGRAATPSAFSCARSAWPSRKRCHLADRAGVALPDASQRTPEVDGKLEALRRRDGAGRRVLHAIAVGAGRREGRAYLESSAAWIRRSRSASVSGTRPRAGNALLGVMARQGIGGGVLVQPGYPGPPDGPGFYDRFRAGCCSHRERPGRVVAFAAARSRARSPSTSTRRRPALREGADALRLDVARDRDAGASRPSSSRATSTASWRTSTASARRFAALGTAFTPPSSAC